MHSPGPTFQVSAIFTLKYLALWAIWNSVIPAALWRSTWWPPASSGWRRHISAVDALLNARAFNWPQINDHRLYQKSQPQRKDQLKELHCICVNAGFYFYSITCSAFDSAWWSPGSWLAPGWGEPGSALHFVALTCYRPFFSSQWWSSTVFHSPGSVHFSTAMTAQVHTDSQRADRLLGLFCVFCWLPFALVVLISS